MKSNVLIRYPRTPHIEGSGLSSGDEDMEVIKFSELRGKFLVVECKMDGASTGISFDDNCELMLQCRGHYLLGNGDWPEFDQFKVWGNTWKDYLFDVLDTRYIMYGEWMPAFHSVYYDLLPHFFMEFDIYDKQTGIFLSTERRNAMTERFPMDVESVRVLDAKIYHDPREMLSLIGRSAFISDSAYEDLERLALGKGIPRIDIDILLSLNKSKLMEGLYVKWEEDGIVKGRYKYVRPDFVQTILSYGKHWLDRPSIPNKMKEGCDMFSIRRDRL